MKQKLTIHSKPDEIQAYHTERAADSLESANERLEAIHSTSKGHAKTQDIKDLYDKLDDVSQATQANHPKGIETRLDELKQAIKDIPPTIIPPQKDFPNFPEIPLHIPTDMTETNRLLNALLNKEEKEMPEYPQFPDFPEIPKTDLSTTNNLLQKLLDKDEDLDITATLEIV